MCLSKSSPEKQSGAYIRIYKELYYKELAHVIKESGRFKINMVCQQARDPGELKVQMKS